MKHLKKFNESKEDHLEMIFGDENTIFQGFNEYDNNDKKYLINNDGKVKLSSTGFADEWVESIDYKRSYAFIENKKLHVIVYGVPSSSDVKDYYKKTLDKYIDREYGEFFETKPGRPICMIVIKNGSKKIV